MVAGVGSTSSTFSFDGVISGLKTADIIQGLMSVEAAPLQLRQAQQTAAASRQKAVLAVQAQVKTLQATIAKLLDPAQLNARAATVNSASSAFLSASATSAAIPG